MWKNVRMCANFIYGLLVSNLVLMNELYVYFGNVFGKMSSKLKVLVNCCSCVCANCTWVDRDICRTLSISFLLSRRIWIFHIIIYSKNVTHLQLCCMAENWGELIFHFPHIVFFSGYFLVFVFLLNRWKWSILARTAAFRILQVSGTRCLRLQIDSWLRKKNWLRIHTCIPNEFVCLIQHFRQQIFHINETKNKKQSQKMKRTVQTLHKYTQKMIEHLMKGNQL